MELKTSMRMVLAAALVGVLGTAPSLAHGPLHEQIDALSQQIAAEPDSAGLFLVRGELYHRDGHSDAAEADYDTAARLDPSLHEVWVCRGQLWQDQGRTRDALAAMDRFLAHAPLDSRALLLRARILVDLGRRAEAIETMDIAIANMASPRPAHYLDRARLLAEAGPASTDRAIAGLDDGVARLGAVLSLHWYAVELYEGAGRYDRALARLDELFAVYTRRDILLARRGDILDAAGRPLEAMVSFTACLEAIEELPDGAKNTEAVKEIERCVRTKLGSIEIESQQRSAR